MTTTINDLIDQYETGTKLRGIAPTQMMALKVVRRGLGHWQPRELTPANVLVYVQQRRAGDFSQAHARRPAADGTVRRELGALSAVLNWAADKLLIKRDEVPTIDLPPQSPAREVFLTVAEADRLFAFAAAWATSPAPGCKVGMFACLALDTWARAAAIETLTWDRIQVAPPQIDYRDPTRHQTSKRRVPVPVSPRLDRVIREHYLAGGYHPAPCEFVVGRVTQYAWKHFIKSAGFPHLTRHDLRRTGASCAVARGVDLMKIAAMLGDDYGTVLKHYARFAPDYLADVFTPRVLNTEGRSATVAGTLQT